MEAETPTEASQQAAKRELESLMNRADKVTMDLAITRRDVQQLRAELQMFMQRWGER
jgi:hypothetical protein